MSLTALLDTLRRAPPAVLTELPIPPTMTPSERLTLFAAMVAEGAADPQIVRLAQALVRAKAMARGRALTPVEVLQALLDGLHGLVEYRDDPIGDWDSYSRAVWTFTPRTDTRLSPITNLRRGAGDCEDMAIAFCALARAVGITARCEWLSQPGAPSNHVAAAFCDTPKGCLWIETTLPGARVGEHPYEAFQRLGSAHRRDISPAISSDSTPIGDTRQ